MTVTSGPPKIVSLTDDVTVAEESSVNFTCDVNNDPEAVGTQNVTILWFGVDNSRINNGGRYSIENSSRDDYMKSFISTLTINPVLRPDHGTYRCDALNHFELKDTDDTSLTVECKLTLLILQILIKICCSYSNSDYHCKWCSYPVSIECDS